MESLVVVMSFHFNYKDGYGLFINVIYNPVVRRYASGPGDILTPFNGSG